MKKKTVYLTLIILSFIIFLFAFNSCKKGCQHEWGEWYITSPSTCSKVGTKQRNCMLCNKTQTDYMDVVDHEYDFQNIAWSWNGYESAAAKLHCIHDNKHEVIIDVAVNENIIKTPNCLQTGTVLYTATLNLADGSTYTNTKSELLPKTDHMVVYDDEIKVACVTDGLTEGSHCAVCNIILVPQEKIEKTGHNEITIPSVAPSCSREGSTEGKKCSACDEMLEAPQTLPKLSHTETLSLGISPSCSAEGLTAGKKCSVCDEIIVAGETIAKLPHTEETVSAVSATCESTGLTEGKKCSVCQEVLVAQMITQKISHNYVTVVTAPLCEAEGYTTHTCSMCDDSYVDSYVDELGHTWGTWNANDGNTKTIRTCQNNCGKYQEIISLSAECTSDYYHLIGETISSDDIVLRVLINDANGTIEEVNDFTLENTLMTLDGENKIVVKYYTLTTIASVIAIPDNLPGTTSSTEFTWSFDETNNCYNLTSFTGSSTAVVIPANINRIPVRNINERAFEGNENILSLEIPASVQSIGAYAFSGCSGLKNLSLNEGLKTIYSGAFVGCPITSLTIPNSVKNMETAYYQQGAFRDCTKLTHVTIGSGLKLIPEYSFANCTALKTLIIGDGVETIGTYAFGGCVSLDSITFGDSLLTIGNNVFENCESIVSVEIPGSVQSIGENAFAGCAGLTTLTLNEGLKTINGGAFMGCPVKTLIIPNSVKTLDTAYYQRGAFKDCTKLTSITIGDGLKSIPEHSFANCTALKTLVIGDGVETIGTYAFGGCVSLESITFGDSLLTVGNNVFENCESIVLVDIPGSVQSIGENAFAGCTGLTTLTLNEGLKTINGGAFMGCPIKTLIIPNSVKTLCTAYYQKGAFKDCTKLTSITIGDGLKSIPEHSFANCTALKTLVIGDAVEYIGEYAFGNCTSLNSITFGDNLITIGNYAFQNCESLETIEIPGTVQTIGECAFVECSALTSLKLNEGLKTIYGGAFMGCPIKTLTIPNSVKTLETSYYQKGAFKDCTQLESVTIGSSLQYISEHSFANCSALKTVNIGNSVETIGEGAFLNCSALTNVTIGTGVITISNYAFENCTALTEIMIPDNVQTIGEYAFKGCTLLVNFNIGTGVQRIGAYALQNCISLKSVAIPSNVQVIGSGMFADCSNLEEVIIQKGVLREIGHDVFNGCSSFDRIYYTGTASDWVLVAVNEDNSYPLNVSPYYYSASSPSAKGNYWYYNNNNEPRVWNVSDIAFEAEYSAENFTEIFGGEDSSYSTTFYNSIQDDSRFQMDLAAWELLHIVADTSFSEGVWQIPKKDLYKLVIYDLLCKETNAQKDILSNLESSKYAYLTDFAKDLFGDDATKEIIEKMLPNTSYCPQLAKYGIVGLEYIFEKSENMYEALESCATYMVLSDMDASFQTVLLQIANDPDNQAELREAAEEYAAVFQMSMTEILSKFAVEYYTADARAAWTTAQNLSWDFMISTFAPSIGAIQSAAKGILFLADLGWDVDDIGMSYYKLDVAVHLEAALRDVIHNTLPDYYRVSNYAKAETYVYATHMYKTSVLLGFDYSNAFLSEYSENKSEEEKEQYTSLISTIYSLKEDKKALYEKFDNSVKLAKAAYYS